MKRQSSTIYIKDYDYVLPAGQIAQFPPETREESRLLIYSGGNIEQDIFSGLGEHLPEKSLLVFNDTKVIRARIIFHKPSGTRIEIFCLEPVSPAAEVQEAFLQQGSCVWKCLVGNMKRWKTGMLVKQIRTDTAAVDLMAGVLQHNNDGSFNIEFKWDPPGLIFAEVLEHAGLVPLPPYIERETDPDDESRYQTVYAEKDGSVAAPTAGLHFTQDLLAQLGEAGHKFAKVTLHVGVGTFRPVTSETIADHEMHGEKIVVSKATIEKILAHCGKPVIAVGTTSARTIETLYWIGLKILAGDTQNCFSIGQWEPYQNPATLPGATIALDALVKLMKKRSLDEIHALTHLLIMPGYSFRIVTALITNFHMPKSTLLLLVAAMAGPGWRDAYQFALHGGFRFLSYGDACLFFPPPDPIR